VDSRNEDFSDPPHADFVFDGRQALEGVSRLESQIHVDQPLTRVGRETVYFDGQAILADKGAWETPV
jgi:hypothetical protein